jgi:hypothetical protein
MKSESIEIPVEIMASSILDRYVDTDVIVRTVTWIYTGHLVAVDHRALLLHDAACIFDTGRWADALADGTLNEIEPYPDEVVVAWDAVIDVSSWNHSLPRKQR